MKSKFSCILFLLFWIHFVAVSQISPKQNTIASIQADVVSVLGSAGADGSYATLKDAFDVINTYTNQAGKSIVISITGNTIETASAVLNQPINSSWVSLTIKPFGGASIITGDLTTPLIDLNGADNVTIDGLNTGGNSLTISNSNTTSNINPAIRFINDACNNTIQNCTLTGSTSLVTNGVILFSSGITTGNDGNTISNSTISNTAGNLPVNSIYSAGSSVTVDNSGNVIAGNNIQDYFSAGLASNGILIASNSSAWMISGNKFFQSGIRTATVGNTHRAINIITAAGVNYTISNNIIGYGNASGSGVTTYGGAFANLYRAIELSVGTTTASNVQGNTITGISLSTTSSSVLPGIFSGISVLAGSVNIGTSTANTIGATTGNGSISITSTTTAGVITGIYSNSIGIVNIQNNIIGSISTGGAAAIGYTFHGLYTTGALGNYSIASNTIGSTSTTNSISIGTNGTTTTGVCTLNGINNAATGTISITSNTVQNVSIYGTGASIFNGIVNTGGTGTLGITTNNIISGTNTGTGAMVGISNSAVVATLNINNNVIRGHVRTAATGIFTGIANTGAVTTTININNNQLGNSGGGLVTYNAANSSALMGINNTGGNAASSLIITGNDIRGIVHSIAGSSAHTYIFNSAITLSQNISNNIFTNLNVNTAGAVTFISNSVALFSNGTQNVNNNSIVTAFNKAGAGGTVAVFTSIGISPAGAAVSHTGNNFSNISVTGATAITGWSITGVGNPTQTITGNSFTNWTGGTSAITGMSINGFGGTSSVSNNIISTISGQAAITGLFIGAVGTATTLTVSGNQISNLTSSGTGGLVTGLSSANISALVNIDLNSINTLASSFNAKTASIHGILVSAALQTNITNNTIQNLSASGTTVPIINGISAATTNNITLQNNNIKGITTTGVAASGYTFNGILTTGATGNFTISDNIIGAVTPNSIAIGTNTVTTGVCIINGINNAATGTISITNNTFQNATIYSSSASVFAGITNSGGSGTLTITGNNILSGTNNGTGAFTAISNSAAVATANINGNIIRNHNQSAATGTFTAILSSGAVANTLNINSNQLGNTSGGLVTYNIANSSTLVGINVSTASTTCALSIQSNDIRGITHSVAGLSAHTYIINTATTLSQNISNNTITNLNVNTIGAIIFISNNVSLLSNGTQDINNNSIVGSFTRTSSSPSGALTLFTSTTANSAAGSVINNSNNNFSYITVSGAATIAGWINTDAGNGTKNIQSNTFSNWKGLDTPTGAFTVLTVNTLGTNNAISGNQINTLTSGGSLIGITTGAGNDNIYSNTINTLISTGTVATVVNGIAVTAGSTKNVYQNSINNLQGNGAITTGNISGIAISAGLASNIYRNKIYNLSSSSSGLTSSINGILVSGATVSLTTNIYNNLIGGISVTEASGTDLIRGISIIPTGASSNINVYFNTIYLNAPATNGVNLGTSGIYHVASATTTTATLDLRNNIIVNNSVSQGTGLTVAFRRSSANLQNYTAASNNNLLLANNLMHNGTTAYTTLATYKTAVSPRDAASISEIPNWLSTVSGDANYLHINSAIQSQLESGGANVASIINDFDGDIRQGNAGYSGSGTAPDIGADEFNGNPKDITAPAISYVPFTNNSCLLTQTLTATITDGTGVNTTAGTKPRIYYKKSTNSNDLTITGWKFTEATNSSSPYTFDIDYSKINGGYAAGVTIQYFVVAQDVLSTPLVGINNGTFATTPVSVALTSTAFPIGGTINSYIINTGLSGTVTVGSGGTYTTLTGAGGLFAAINSNGLSSNLTANIISDITSETGAISLNAINYGCGSTPFTLTILPSGGTARIISGSIDSNPLINLNGANNVIIDGLNAVGNSLTISNTSTVATTGTSTIRFINDASNNIIRNATIAGSSTLISTGTILFSSGISSGNDVNTITGCTIIAAGGNLPFNSIYSSGSSLTVDNSGISITNNNIQDYYNPIGASNGVYIASNSAVWTITGNKFFQSGTRTATASAASPFNVHRAINIITASGGGYSISSNTIGYSAADATGITTYDGNFANRFVGIEITTSLTPVSNIQGNNIKAISLSTSNALTTAPGIFTGISVLAGSVNVGTTTGNTIGATTGTGSISTTSSTSLGYIAGIYTTSLGTVNIQNNNIGSISTGGTATIGYAFNGINTAGLLGNFSISDNSIGSASTVHCVAMGTSGLTTAVCAFNGINNSATGNISITSNTIQNTTVYGSGVNVFNGIINTGGTGTLTITGNNIISGTNTGIYGTTKTPGVLTAISNSAAVKTLNINNNVIRGFSRTATTGTFIGIANTGAVTTAISINNNQLGNASGDLITYGSANSSALIGISNSTGAMAATSLAITGNDFRGIVHSVQGSSAHTYIINSAITLSQNITNNTFTDLKVNTTGAITFISNSVVLFSNGIQNVNNNSIVTAFNKAGAGGVVTLFSSAAIIPVGAVINHNGNNFSKITVTGATTIAGWSITGAGKPTQTIAGNTFTNWTGGTAAITGMSINGFGGTSSVSNNTISTISGQAAITGLLIGATGTATSLIITGNNINNLASSGTGGLVTGLSSANISPLVNINTNTINTLSSSLNTATASIHGILISAATLTNITNNTIQNLSASGTTVPIINGISATTTNNITLQNNSINGITTTGLAASGYAFNGILSTGATGNFTIKDNTIGTSSPHSITLGTNSVTTGVCTFSGIKNSATGTISITNNTVQNATLFGTGASVFVGISNSGGNGTLTITGNNILSGTNFGTGAFTGILNSAASAIANINENIIRSHIRNANGTFTAISSTGAVANTLNINSNQLGSGGNDLITFNAANSGALLGINVTTAGSSCALNILSNDFRGITSVSPAIQAHNYIINAAATLSQNISYNTFTSLNVNTTGTITFISNNVAAQSAGTQNINNNSIVGSFVRNIASASGGLTLFTSSASSAAGAVINNNNNNFSNITVSGSATIAGWINTDAGNGTNTMQGNTFSNWNGETGAITVMNVNQTATSNSTTNNAINTIISSGNITGITTAAGNENIYSNTIFGLISSGTAGIIVNGIAVTAGTTNNIYQNKIYNLKADNITIGSVSGIAVSGGIINNIYRNKIYDISSSSSGITTGKVNGILVSGATVSLTTNINNNIIGDLRASAAIGTDVIRGISIIATGATSNINVYYNTVFLEGSTSAGTSGIYHIASATPTVATLDLRNNIIVNNSVGAGTAVAFRRSAVNLENYASSSNNNLFFGINILYNGTAYTNTLTDYKTVVSPRDDASITEDPNWVSTTGADDTYLHIRTDIVTQIEGGAANIAGLSVDYDGDVRQGNTGYSGGGSAPDIGADEFNGGIPTLTWDGGAGTNNWSDALNWIYDYIPTASHSVVLDGAYTINMDINATVKNFLISNPDLSLTIQANKTLTVNGDLAVSNGTLNTQSTFPTATGAIDVSGGTIGYTGSGISQAVSVQTYKNLTIDNTAGVTASADITVNGILSLTTNPSSTQGCLDMGVNTLTMGATATTVGVGDVTGIIKRTSLLPNIEYSFGSKYTTTLFPTPDLGATLPTDWSIKVSIGTAPSWKTDAIKRTYDVKKTGGNDINPEIKFRYLESELNGNQEDNIVVWGNLSDPEGVYELGITSINLIENWVKMSGPIDFAQDSFDKNIWTLATRGILPNFSWLGGIAGSETDWNEPFNWKGATVPDATNAVLIPADRTYYPTLPIGGASVLTLSIQSGAVVNGVANTITIAGSGTAWFNKGTFNAGTSTVIFTNSDATIAGTTDFYNLTINSGAVLKQAIESITRIGGAVTNNGTWRTVIGGATTIEYNGGVQTVLVPNSATNRYFNLILSGTGIKTMPLTPLEIVGDFTLSETASVTLGNNMTFSGNVLLGSGTTLNASTFTHQIKKNWTNTGATLQAATSTLIFNGMVAQTITNSAGFSPYNLTITNLLPVTLGTSSDCSIGGSLIVNIGSVFNLSTNSITNIAGSISNAGTIKTISTSITPLPSGKTWNGKVEFAGLSAQTIVAGTYNNLILNGTGGLTATADLTVNGALTLSSANPTSTKGLLDMASYTLTMGAASSTIGQGDVTGIIKRTTIAANTTYTFGNALTTINFPSVGNLPTQLSFKVNIGAAPLWKTGAIMRTLEIIQTGAIGTQATLKIHYLDSELNGNTENNLVNWVWLNPQIIEYGRSDNNVITNIVEISNFNIGVFSATFDSSQISLANAVGNNLTWNGSVSSSWNNPQNWTPTGLPSFQTALMIPSGTTNILSLPIKAECNKFILNGGSTVNAQTDANLLIYGSTGAWENKGGTFNYGSSQIIFNNANAKIIGSTNFYDLKILTGAKLTPDAAANIGIYGSILNIGEFHPEVNVNTVEYKGADQTVVIPTLSKYSNLILSGTRVKTMPAVSLTVAANFSMAGSTTTTNIDPLIVLGNFTLNGASVYTSGDQLDVGGDMTINSGTIMNAGNSIYNHNITGNWINNGSFDAAASVFNFIGTSNQTIGGTSTTTFNDFGINKSSNGLTLNTGTKVNGTLILTNGLINTGIYTLTIGDAGDISGGSATSYINGKLARQFSGIDSKFFPVGKGGVYRPLTVEYTPLTGTSTITAEQFEAAMTGTFPTGTTIGPSRYWTITESGGTGTYKLTLDATGYNTYLPLEPKIFKKGGTGTIVAFPATVLDDSFNTSDIIGSGDFTIGKGYLDSPDIQASKIEFTNITATTFDISWNSGNGDNAAVFMKDGSGAITNPTNGTTYTASSNWSSKGTQLGTSGYYCIYNGPANLVSILAGLLPKTTYTVQVFEYNGYGETSSYQIATATDNPNSQLTLNNPSTADYRSRVDGNYNDLATWEYNDTGTGTETHWADAIQAPAAGSNVYILDGNEVTLTANATLNTLKTIDISGTLVCNSTRTISGAGNLILQSSGTLKIASPTGFSGNVTLTGTVDISNGTVEFNGVAAQTQTARTFANLIINNSSTGVTLTGAMSVTNDLTLTTGNLITGTNTLTISGNTPTRTSGMINASSGTLAFTNSIAIILPPSIFTGNVKNMTLNGAGGLTLGSVTTVSGLLALTSGTLTIGANTLTLSGNLPPTGSGKLDAILGTLEFANLAPITLPASLFTGNINNLTLYGTGGVTLGSATTVAGTLALTAGTLTTGVNTLTLSGSSPTRGTGTMNVAAGTLAFTNSSAITLPASIFTGNVNNLIINGTGGVTLGSATTLSGSLNLSLGTLTAGSNLSMQSTSAINRSEGNMSGIPQGAGVYNLTYTGNNKTSGTELSGTGLNNVTLNLTAGQTLTLGQSRALSGTLTLNTGTLAIGANTLTFSGNSPIRVSGFIDASNVGATLAFTNPSATITLPASLFTGNINNLTLNGAGGITLGSDVSVNAVLTLTSGILTTGANTLTIGSSGSFTGGSSTSFVNGKLARVFISNVSKTYPVGKAGNYRPLTLNYTALSGTSTVTVEQMETTIPGALPANSNALNTFNRYWSINQTGGISFAFKVTLDGTGWTPTRTANMLQGDGITNNAYNVTTPNYTSSANFTSFGNFSLGEVNISWNGLTNNDWFESSNWSSSTVPTPNDYIIIPSSLPSYPNISGSSPANDITLTSTANLEIQTGATLTLESGPVLKFNIGTNVTTGVGAKIRLKSDAIYLNLSSSSPFLEAQRQLTGNKGWRMVASPVETKIKDMFKSPLVTQGFTGATIKDAQPNLLWWDETDPGTTLQSWRQPSDTANAIVQGRGYFHYVFNGAGITGTKDPVVFYSDVLPQTMTVTGIEKAVGSGVSYPLTYTTRTAPTSGTNYLDVNEYDKGWNLIGNHTASTLDWDAASGWTKINMDNSIYVWDPAANGGNGDYLTWNGSTGTLTNGKIAPFQAFWVRSNANSPVLTFNNDAKVARAANFYRAPAENKPISIPIKLEYKELNTTSFVSLSNTGITGYDSYDAYRLVPMSDTWLELYTLSSTDHTSPLVINNLPLNDTTLVNIPLFVDGQNNGVGIKGTCILKWNLPENWPSDWYINLQDNTNSKMISMNDVNEYKFDFTSASSGNLTSTKMFTPKQILSKNSSNSSKTKNNLPLYSIIISKGTKIDQFIDPLPTLISNYPNPFSSFTRISYSLPKTSKVQIDIFDLRGGKIKTLVNTTSNAGLHEVTWNPENILPGVYLIRFISDTNVSVLKTIFKNSF